MGGGLFHEDEEEGKEKENTDNRQEQEEYKIRLLKHLGNRILKLNNNSHHQENEEKSSKGDEISEQRKTVLSKWGDQFIKWIEKVDNTTDN